MPIGGPKSDQTAVGDAIRKTAQETKKLYTRKLSSSMEYQGAVQKYQEVRWNTIVQIRVKIQAVQSSGKKAEG